MDLNREQGEEDHPNYKTRKSWPIGKMRQSGALLYNTQPAASSSSSAHKPGGPDRGRQMW